jgi:hypothetical protein
MACVMLHNMKIKDENFENLEQTFDVKLKKHKKSK